MVRAPMAPPERVTNEDEAGALDPLAERAMIHSFESIHPFSDGNGRLGRIVDLLHLSRWIAGRQGAYHRLLQAVRDRKGAADAWEAWLLYRSRGVAETARGTLALIEGMRVLMADDKQRIRGEHPKIYSQDLLNNLFRHPYTRSEYVERELRVSRPTATGYLDTLAAAGFLDKQRIGRNNYYMNQRLVALFMDGAA